MPRNQSEARPRGRDALQVQAAGPDRSKSTGDPRQHHDPTPVELTEAALLGAAILSPDALAGIVTELDPDAFLREAHRQVFVTLAEMHAAEVTVDQVTLTDALVESGRIDVTGGLSAPFDLASIDCCPTVAAWPHYLAIIRRQVARRRQVADHLDALRKLGVDVQEVAA
jgi:replicative DNA helicase